MKSKRKNPDCPHCRSSNTYFLGEDSWIQYYHCTCGHDFKVDTKEYAWTKQEIDEQEKKAKN